MSYENDILIDNSKKRMIGPVTPVLDLLSDSNDGPKTLIELLEDFELEVPGANHSITVRRDASTNRISYQYRYRELYSALECSSSIITPIEPTGLPPSHVHHEVIANFLSHQRRLRNQSPK